MARVRVKICGITSVEDGLMAAQAGADAVGFVFWPASPRAVDVETARRIVQALPPFVTRVGVFVDASREELACVADAVGLDLLQLHGQESIEDLERLPRPALKALRVDESFSLDLAARYAERAAGLLLDAGTAARPGGTGHTFDWSVARGVRERVGVLVLAGGLTPANVGAAIAAVAPAAVDVSTGVESAPGRKDAAKVRAFIEAVRHAESLLA
jgi:phosphoribosylanthranilate isomerase